jgi:hypothetical protein
LESVAGKEPYTKILFIENGEITIAIDKDSIQKSKVSGTYSNDEYVKFNEEIKVVQKKLISESKHASNECSATSKRYRCNH